LRGLLLCYRDATLLDRSESPRSITVLQPALRLERCASMQAVTRVALEISALPSRKASPVHICWAWALMA